MIDYEQETDGHIGKFINILSKNIRYACNSYLTGQGIELTWEQARLLRYIEHLSLNNEICYQRDIESEFSIKRSSVANILANMEKNGYIIRSTGKGDARIKTISLTPKWEEISKGMKENIESIESAISRDMTDEEKAQFLSLIKRAIVNLDSLDKADDKN